MDNRQRIALIGSSGMLGQDLLQSCRESGRADLVTFADRAAIDIGNASELAATMSRLKPDIIINAAAFTDVDGAELHRDEADRVNHGGPAVLALICRNLDALLVQFSTDYVFNGRSSRSYRTDDAADPINWYGRTKHLGEEAIRESGCRHLIVRSSWLFAAHGRNFVKTILRLAESKQSLDVVNDQRGRPTLSRDLAEFTCRLVAAGATGTYHVANNGDCTWYEFAEAIVETAGLSCHVNPTLTRDAPRPARRPEFSVLDLMTTTDRVGYSRHWRDALAECLHIILHDGVDPRADREALLCG